MPYKKLLLRKQQGQVLKHDKLHERCYIEAILNPQQTISKECLWPGRCELPSLGRSITSPLVATKERLCLLL